MSCPSFADLGSEAKNVFRSGFIIGFGNFNASSKIFNNFDIGGNVKHNIDENSTLGSAFLGYSSEERGKIIGKYTHQNVFSLQYFFGKSLLENIDMNTLFSHNIESSESSIQINSKYATDDLHGNCSLTNPLELNLKAAFDIVYRFKDTFVGYQTGFDTETSTVTKNNFGLGFGVNSMGFHFRCNSIPREFGLSIYRKVNDQLDVAMNGLFAKKGDSQFWTLGIGTKYEFNENSIFRCKLDKDGQIGMSLCQRLHDILNFTVSFNVDCANLGSGGHKAGFSIELEA